MRVWFGQTVPAGKQLIERASEASVIRRLVLSTIAHGSWVMGHGRRYCSDTTNSISALSWLFTTVLGMSNSMVSPFSRVYAFHGGSTPSTLGSPVLAKLIQAQLMLSARECASSEIGRASCRERGYIS